MEVVRGRTISREEEKQSCPYEPGKKGRKADRKLQKK
jgi:hypothetical protein